LFDDSAFHLLASLLQNSEDNLNNLRREAMKKARQKKGLFKRFVERLEKAQVCSPNDRNCRHVKMNGTRRRV
jgi:hypothetical protein